MDKIVKLMTSPEEKRKLLNSSWWKEKRNGLHDRFCRGMDVK
jgi:hypothetical protein